MTRMGLSLAIGACLVLSSAPAGEKAKPFKHSAEETKIFELTNLERQKKKLPALTLSASLTKIARAHSENMARQNKMEHKLDGKTHGDRVRAAGYKFLSVGENLAAAEKGATLPNLMKEWMDSEGHRDNLLEPEYTEVGVGMFRDKTGQMWFTQVFALPKKE